MTPEDLLKMNPHARRLYLDPETNEVYDGPIEVPPERPRLTATERAYPSTPTRGRDDSNPLRKADKAMKNAFFAYPSLRQKYEAYATPAEGPDGEEEYYYRKME